MEIPLLVLMAGTLGAVLLSRLQDVLPFAAYTEAKGLESRSSGGGGDGVSAAASAQA